MLSSDLPSEPITDLKSILLTMEATGGKGFEGLLRVVLTELTGIPFRLAVSGLQGGVDGDSAFQRDAVSFEAKRYSGIIQRGDVLTKLADLARKSRAPDRLWVLGATVEIGAQLASAVQEDGDKNAISTLVLDWTSDPLPLLAVAIVAAGNAAINFLVAHCNPPPERSDLVKKIKEISEHPAFVSLLHRLQSNLNVSTLAMARSIKASKEWRANSFGSRRAARERLGQALVVSINPAFTPLRAVLRAQVEEHLNSGQDIVLAGGEGHGKSWLAAQVCNDYEGLTVFASAEQFEGVVPSELDKILIELLIKQTGDVLDEAVQLRWRHRLAAWQNQPPSLPLLVFVDGINQRDSLPWDKTLNGLQERLQAIGGRLIVTVRPQFWRRNVVPGLDFEPKLIEVPVWLPEERDQLLRHYGIKLDWLDNATLETLLNPRLLGVAVATLPHQNSTAWKGLTRDRILFEHLRASQRENFEPETLAELTTRLSRHAKEVLERVRASPHQPPQNFESESAAVIETRFFKSLPGPDDVYELRSEGLTLALGYTLVDQLWKAHRAGLVLSDRIAHLVDPIHAMDRTADVMFAALMVCALDPVRFNEAIFRGLLDAFSRLQNVSDQRFDEFVEISKNQPVEFFKALEVITLERGRRLNQDWFSHAAFEVAGSVTGWPVAEASIHRWLHCYNKNAVEQASRYPKQGNEEDLRYLRSKQGEIREVLSSLSAFERSVLEQMTEVSGETNDLFALALYLLAGRPLAGFARSFVALGIGFAFDRDVSSARKAFRQLAAFNRVDPEEAMTAFLNAIAPLRAPETSKSGRWTMVRMLFATGDESAAAEAGKIAEQLRMDWPSWGTSLIDGWRQLHAADPDAARPTDMELGTQLFCAISPDTLMQSMGQTGDDYDLKELLPVLCRFDPLIAVGKVREILSGLLTRTAFPLRQLILNGTTYAPLMTRDLALQLVSRVVDRNVDIVEAVTERERDILRRFLFSYVAPLLTPPEQLDCMADSAFGITYLLSVIPSLKPQSSDAILRALRVALEANDDDAIHRTLAAARYGDTPATPELESLLLKSMRSNMSAVRAISFELAIEGNLKALRDFHVHSDWSALSEASTAGENWFGSLLLADACSRGELATEALFQRISPETWFVTIEKIGDEKSKPLVGLFLRRLRGALNSFKDLVPPHVDLTLSTVDPAPYTFLSIAETDRIEGRFPRQKSLVETLEEQKDFYVSRDRIRVISDAFLAKIKGTDALLAIERVRVDEMRSLVRLDSSIFSQILETLERASSSELVWLRNIVLLISNLASTTMPERAFGLFQRALAVQGFITHDLGDNLTLEHEAVWSSARSKEIELLWLQRLFQCENDEVLAREVLAAERFGAAAFIRSFVTERAESESTLDQAYAISVAGFSFQSEQLLTVIEAHLGDSGLTGDAAKSAKAAHMTAQWGQQWVEDMCAAQSPEEFWRCLMIAQTCMDARVSVELIKDTYWENHTPLLRSVRTTAIKEQDKGRKKTLLGQEAPERIFVSPKQYHL